MKKVLWGRCCPRPAFAVLRARTAAGIVHACFPHVALDSGLHFGAVGRPQQSRLSDRDSDRCEYQSANAGGSTHPCVMLDALRELGCLPLRFDHIRSISASVRPHRVVRIASSGPKSGWRRGVDPRMGPAERRLVGGRRSRRFARRASWLMPLRAHTRGSPSPSSIAWARQGARPAHRANPRAKRPASGRERVYESATLRRAPPRIGVPFGRLESELGYLSEEVFQPPRGA